MLQGQMREMSGLGARDQKRWFISMQAYAEIAETQAVVFFSMTAYQLQSEQQRPPGV